jgi:hypothetical protein
MSDQDEKGIWHAQVWTTEFKWVSVGTSAGKTYTYDSAEEAAKMLRSFYPDQYRMDRLDKTMWRVRVFNNTTKAYSAAWLHA